MRRRAIHYFHTKVFFIRSTICISFCKMSVKVTIKRIIIFIQLTDFLQDKSYRITRQTREREYHSDNWFATFTPRIVTSLTLTLFVDHCDYFLYKHRLIGSKF